MIHRAECRMEEGIGPVVLNRFGGRGARYAANPVTVPGFAPPETLRPGRSPKPFSTPSRRPDVNLSSVMADFVAMLQRRGITIQGGSRLATISMFGSTAWRRGSPPTPQSETQIGTR